MRLLKHFYEEVYREMDRRFLPTASIDLVDIQASHCEGDALDCQGF